MLCVTGGAAAVASVVHDGFMNPIDGKHFLTFVLKGNYSITECVTSFNILLGYCITVTMVDVAAAEPLLLAGTNEPSVYPNTPRLVCMVIQYAH